MQTLPPASILGKPVRVITLLALLQTPALQAQTDSASALKKLSVEELMNLEVTSVSKHPEKLSEAASAIQVITQDDIRRSGATSLPEALRLATNLEVAQIDTRRWAISARGLNTETANQLLVLLDGRALYTPRLAGVFWDVQDTLLEDIERIEVISGPGAALWGGNAVNGVINITTKSAADTQGILLTGGGGNELRHFGGLRFGGTLGASNYRVYAKRQERDGPVLNNGTDLAGGWDMSQAGMRIDSRLSGRDTLTVQGDAYQARFEQAAAADVDANGNNLLLRWSRTLDTQSGFDLQLYHDFTHRDTPGIVSETLHTYDLDFQQRLLASTRHSVVWGIGYRRYDSRTYNFVGQLYQPASKTSYLYSGFIQDEIALLENTLRLTVGTKLEHNDYTGFEFQPSLRLAWTPDSRQTLWSAVSRAVRTPARNDRELFTPVTAPYTRVGNDSFASEELLAYELGYRVQPQTRLSVAAAAFYNDYDKLRSVEPVNPPATSPTTIGNGQQGHAYGAELTLEYRPTDWWQLRLADTEIRIALRPRPGSRDLSYGRSESFDPKHQITLRSAFDLPRGLQLDATYRHISRIVNNNIPAYSELDLRLGWQVSAQLELSLTGQNLLHAHHAEFSTTTQRREIERNVYGKLTWQF
ncbi:MAG: TonB-dependent receptor [Paludibacter sp.]